MILTVISTIAGCLALGLVVAADLSRAELRARSAQDSCVLFRGLVLAATPKGQLTRAQAYISSTALHNCYAYGQDIANHP